MIVPDEAKKTTGGPVKVVPFTGYSVGHLAIKVLPGGGGDNTED